MFSSKKIGFVSAIMSVGILAISANVTSAGNLINRAKANNPGVVEMNGKMQKSRATPISAIPLTATECVWLGGTITLDVNKCPNSKMRCQGSNGRSICIKSQKATTK